MEGDRLTNSIAVAGQFSKTSKEIGCRGSGCKMQADPLGQISHLLSKYGDLQRQPTRKSIQGLKSKEHGKGLHNNSPLSLQRIMKEKMCFSPPPSADNHLRTNSKGIKNGLGSQSTRLKLPRLFFLFVQMNDLH
jgi:hypothetical protein